jgi:3D (Asp-Asp-Asp) domain-containing protein
MDCTAKTIKIRKTEYFLCLGVITAGLVCFCLRIGVGASGAVPLNTRLPVEEQISPVLLEVKDVIDFEPSPEIITEPDTEQELLDLLRSSTLRIDKPAQQNPPVKADKVDILPRWKTVRMRVTGYCACPICCGNSSDGITANMHRIRRGDVFAAADKKVPFGTHIIIPGYNSGRSIEVKDRGGLIQGNHLDLYFTNHKTAQKWGVKHLDVRVRLDE